MFFKAILGNTVCFETLICTVDVRIVQRKEATMKSPGHQQYPEQSVRDAAINQVGKVRDNGLTIAESDQVIELVENAHPSATTSQGATSTWRP